MKMIDEFDLLMPLKEESAEVYGSFFEELEETTDQESDTLEDVPAVKKCKSNTQNGFTHETVSIQVSSYKKESRKELCVSPLILQVVSGVKKGKGGITNQYIVKSPERERNITDDIAGETTTKADNVMVTLHTTIKQDDTVKDQEEMYIPQKRKRGRPRKIVLSTTGNNAELQKHENVSFRNKQKSADYMQTDLYTEEHREANKICLRPRKQTFRFLEDYVYIPKRRRGRPKLSEFCSFKKYLRDVKNHMEKCGNENVKGKDSIIKIKKKRGRPRKIPLASTTENGSENMLHIKQEFPVYITKEVWQAENDCIEEYVTPNDLDFNVPTNVAKGGNRKGNKKATKGGKRRKTKKVNKSEIQNEIKEKDWVEGTSLQQKSLECAVKKKRGRPRKYPSVSDINKPKQKRGRPPKKNFKKKKYSIRSVKKESDKWMEYGREESQSINATEEEFGITSQMVSVELHEENIGQKTNKSIVNMIFDKSCKVKNDFSQDNTGQGPTKHTIKIKREKSQLTETEIDIRNWLRKVERPTTTKYNIFRENNKQARVHVESDKLIGIKNQIRGNIGHSPITTIVHTGADRQNVQEAEESNFRQSKKYSTVGREKEKSTNFDESSIKIFVKHIIVKQEFDGMNNSESVQANVKLHKPILIKQEVMESDTEQIIS